MITFTNILHPMTSVYASICEGVEPRMALGNFLNDFADYHPEQRAELIRDEICIPANHTTEQYKWAIFCVAAVEHLCEQYNMTPPAWVNQALYTEPLNEKWFFVPAARHNAQVRERYERETPATFARRNIFCGQRILQHKTAPLIKERVAVHELALAGVH